MSRSLMRLNREDDHRLMVKTKPIGMADRSIRSSMVREQRKQLRDEQIDKRRKMPLSDLTVNVVINNIAKDSNGKSETKQFDARRQQLLKWREARKFKRAEEQEKNKRKEFVVRHTPQPSYPGCLPSKQQLPAGVQKVKPGKKKLKTEAPYVENIMQAKRVTRSATTQAKSEGSVRTRSKTKLDTSSDKQRTGCLVKKKSTTKTKEGKQNTGFKEGEKTHSTEKETPIIDLVTKPEQPSFVPSGFTFQPPTGLDSFSHYGKSFSFKPLTPSAADKFMFPTQIEKHNNKDLVVVNNVTSEEIGSSMFREMVERETTRLQGCCCDWERELEGAEQISEEVLGMIRSVVGQVQLLVTKKFRQFKELIQISEDPNATQKTLNSDLQGFWDMMYFQVEDIDRKFKRLHELKLNNWKEPEVVVKTETKKPKKKTATAAKQTNKTSSDSRSKLREFMRLQREAKLQEKANSGNEGDCLMFVG